MNTSISLTIPRIGEFNSSMGILEHQKMDVVQTLIQREVLAAVNTSISLAIPWIGEF